MNGENPSWKSQFKIKDNYDLIILCIMVILLILFVTNILPLFDIQMWRPDALIYVDSKLRILRYGRWITALVLDVLKNIPPQIHLITRITCLFFIAFSVAARTTQNYWYGLTFAFFIFQTQTFYQEVGWICANTLAYVFLAILASVRVNNIRELAFYFIISGVLLFGVYSPLYFIMLIFVVNVVYFPLDRIKTYFQILGLWVIGFCVGYATSEIIVRIITGEFIPIPAHYERLKRSFLDINAVYNDALHIFYPLQENVWLVLLLIAFLVYMVWYGKDLLRLGISLPALFAAFVFSLITGLFTAPRAAVSTWFGFSFLFFIFRNMSRKQYCMAAFLMLFTACVTFPKTHDAIIWHKKIGNSAVAEAKKALTMFPPSEVGKVKVEVNKEYIHNMVQAFQYRLNIPVFKGEGLLGGEAYRIASLFQAAGYPRVFVEIKSDEGPLYPSSGPSFVVRREGETIIVRGNSPQPKRKYDLQEMFEEKEAITDYATGVYSIESEGAFFWASDNVVIYMKDETGQFVLEGTLPQLPNATSEAAFALFINDSEVGQRRVKPGEHFSFVLNEDIVRKYVNSGEKYTVRIKTDFSFLPTDYGSQDNRRLSYTVNYIGQEAK